MNAATPLGAWGALCNVPWQATDIYTSASGGSACGATRFLTMGSPGLGEGATLSSASPYGFAFGLIQNDMIEKFLLHFFTMSAHGYTRGTYVTHTLYT